MGGVAAFLSVIISTDEFGHDAEERPPFRAKETLSFFSHAWRQMAPSKFTVRHCGILGHFWPGMKAVTYRPKLFGFVRIDGRYIVWHFLLRQGCKINFATLLFYDWGTTTRGVEPATPKHIYIL